MTDTTATPGLPTGNPDTLSWVLSDLRSQAMLLDGTGDQAQAEALTDYADQLELRIARARFDGWMAAASGRAWRGSPARMLETILAEAPQEHDDHDGGGWTAWLNRSAAISIESTGSSPVSGLVLEVSCVVVDEGLHPVDDGITLAVHHPPATIQETGGTGWVLHDRSGLVEACSRSSWHVSDADRVVEEYLIGHFEGGRLRPRLMSNSAAFERSWLSRHLPAVHDALHTRDLDVSSVREMVRTWFPEVYRSAPDRPQAHRARPNVLACIAELRHYLEHLLRAVS